MDLPSGCAGGRLETLVLPIYGEGARAIVRLLLDLASPVYGGIEGAQLAQVGFVAARYRRGFNRRP
jgi:hypothetical protein